MTTRVPRTARAATFSLLLGSAVLFAACGGSAATPAATSAPTTAATTAAPATPALTSAPTTAPTDTPTTAPTEAPTDAPSVAPSTTPVPTGTLANTYDDFVAYYSSQGYTCGDPTASSQAGGWMLTRCIEDNGATAPSNVIGLVVDPDGVLGDIFAGVVNRAGAEMPTTTDMITPLSFVLGGAMGSDDGTTAATWLAENLGKEMANTTINGNTVATYTENDANGVGAYVEIATPAFLDAPAP